MRAGGPVFVNIHGEPLRGYKHWFDPAVKEAGLKEFTWYCLRHTFASRLAMAGVDLRTLAELMGHETIQMTMRYAHLAPSHTLAAVERLVSQSGFSVPTSGATVQEGPTATKTATAGKFAKGIHSAASNQVAYI
jgi:Phage integrase family